MNLIATLLEHFHGDWKLTIVSARSACDTAIRSKVHAVADCRVASAPCNDNKQNRLFSSQRENALAPIFLGVTGGDVAMARIMAIQTVSTQRVSSLTDLLAVAQIVAYGLAALGSLSLSMDDDLPLAMVLRLRGNANACTCSAEQNRRAIRNDRHEKPLPRDQPMPEPEMHHAEPWPETTENDGPGGLMDDMVAEVLVAEARKRLVQCAEKATDRAPVPQPVPVCEAAVPSPAADKRHNEMWAIAMVNEASEITASIPGLPPAERHAASLRAGMLSSTANRLLTGLGNSLPPLSDSDAGRPAQRERERPG